MSNSQTVPPKTPYFEHINILTTDAKALMSFLSTAIESLQILRSGNRNNPKGTWRHFGNDFFYIAIEEFDTFEGSRPSAYKDSGVNHTCWVVHDFDALCQRMDAKQYRKMVPSENNPFRKRIYYYDAEEREWEFVEYLSNSPDERNSD